MSAPSSIPLLVPDPPAPGSVEEALLGRRTERNISQAQLPQRLLGDLLWAACGVNRRHGPFGVSGRTAASASNCSEIDVYVLMDGGAWLYDPEVHTLQSVTQTDCRSLAMTPRQSQALADAPVQLVFVVDLDKLTHTRGFDEPGLHDEEIQKSYYFVDAGMIAANVYVFASARGLAAWFHNCDKAKLAHALHLRPAQRALFAQSVGFPAGERGA